MQRFHGLYYYLYILSFEPFVEVLEPSHIMEILIHRLKNSLDQYL